MQLSSAARKRQYRTPNPCQVMATEPAIGVTLAPRGTVIMGVCS
jgi:hypothetical protein